MRRFIAYLIVAIFFTCLIMQAVTAADYNVTNATKLFGSPGVDAAFTNSGDFTWSFTAEQINYWKNSKIQKKYPGAFKLSG